MTHGHDLRGEGIARRRGATGYREAKGKNSDNCNSIINKIYLKIKIYLFSSLIISPAS